MQTFQFYAANLFSLDCEKSALLYSRLFSFSIWSKTQNHAELRSDSGFVLFIDKPSLYCNVTQGTISFTVPELNLKEINLDPLKLESYNEKNMYVSFLDEYSNRIWVFKR